MTPEQLASPHFSRAYVSALERGDICPSRKALEYLADRLELPLAHFLSGIEAFYDPVQKEGEKEEKQQPQGGEQIPLPALGALQEDLNYQYNYARMLLRREDPETIEEALALIEVAEQIAAAYAATLPPRMLYRPHFLRGMAYMRRSELTRALPHLEQALDAAGSDEQSAAIVHNMFGVAYYLLQQPSKALHHHLRCLYALHNGVVKDLSLKLSILHNLANDYWALNDAPNAIDAYKQALPLVEDLNGPDRQARTLWALAVAYRAANNRPMAKAYAARALSIYEALDDMAGASSVYIHLAELFIREERYADAEQLLAKAERIVEQAHDPLLLSVVHTDYADLHRRQGDIEAAARHIYRSLSFIQQITGEDIEIGTTSADESGCTREDAPHAVQSTSVKQAAPEQPAYPPIEVARAHVEALQVAALLEEARGNRDETDRLFEKAKGIVGQTELVELASELAFSYAELLQTRGDYVRASQQYRTAAHGVLARNKHGTQPPTGWGDPF